MCVKLISSITPQDSFMRSCDKSKKYGYKTTYNPAEDQTCKNYEKKSAQRAKSSALDVADAKKDEELKKINEKNLKKVQSKPKQNTSALRPKLPVPL